MDIGWSPNHSEKFYTFGADISLCELYEAKDRNYLSEEDIPISDQYYARLRAVISDHGYKCVAWRPHPSPDHLLAIGYQSGKVLLKSFEGVDSLPDTMSLVGREFVLRHSRPCHFLHWNPVDTHLLAVGLDRHRHEGSILIWDVRTQPISEYRGAVNERKSSASTENINSITKPLYEIGLTEASVSMCWFNDNPKTFVTGMSNKYLRIYDLRDPSRAKSFTFTKSVYSVTVDKLFQHRIASCHETQAMIWDTRNFEKPVATLQEQKNISKIAFSPSRIGVLACIQKDSPLLKIYNVGQSYEEEMARDTELAKPTNGLVEEHVERSIFDPVIVERMVQPSGSSVIYGFDWHPTQKNRILTVNPAGIVNDVRLHERSAISWSADIYLAWADHQDLRLFHAVKMCKEASDDISVKMRRRALKGYGVALPLDENLQCVSAEEKLRKLWTWIIMMTEQRKYLNAPLSSAATKAVGDGSNISVVAELDYTFPGVHTVLQASAGPSRTDASSWPWLRDAADVRNWQDTRSVYSSCSRQRALKLCGWTSDRDGSALKDGSSSLQIISRLHSEKEYERAAAIACFAQDIQRSLDELREGIVARQQPSNSTGDATAVIFNMVAMTLSAYVQDQDSVTWRNMCVSTRPFVEHPYLLAILDYLTFAENYDAILEAPKLELADQLAFACVYLSDSALKQYMERMSAKYIAEGNPIGILLTGLTPDGLSLFERYIDVTYDLQTVAVVLVQSLPCSQLTADNRVKQWIQEYRDLLDRWSLWKERAEFDVFLRHREKSFKDDPKIIVGCNFCSKSVCFNSLSKANYNSNSMTASGGTFKLNANRVTSCPGEVPSCQAFVWQTTCCPSCRKPLPRCALCLLHLGTAAVNRNRNPTHQKLTPLSDWFTWCQTCRHGGHANHIAEWFEVHDECPVFGCPCRCSKTDNVRPLSQSSGENSSPFSTRTRLTAVEDVEYVASSDSTQSPVSETETMTRRLANM